MRDRLFRKGLVVGIIVLFIGIAFSPNIIAIDLSKQNSVNLNSKTTSSVSKTSDKGYDIALVDIVPYKWQLGLLTYDIRFTARVKNVGDAPYTGWIGYNARAINLRNNKVEAKTGSSKSGGLQPGESWCPSRGHGLNIHEYHIQTPYSLQFTATPTDSNPENNYLSEMYLIWTDWFGPRYKLINKTRPINKAYISTPFQWFLQEHLNLFPLLRYLLRL